MNQLDNQYVKQLSSFGPLPIGSMSLMLIKYVSCFHYKIACHD